MIRLPATALLLALAPGVALAAAALRPDLATLQAVPRVELPASAVPRDFTEPGKGVPYRYAVPVDLEIEARHGVALQRGEAANWRVRLQSRGAQSLGLRLVRPRLPAGVTLWAYDPAGRLVHGPYDAKRVARSGLWLPPVGGEELVLEARGPAAALAAMRLGSAKAFVGYRGWVVESSADNCNVDITCPAAEDWVASGGSVARVSIGGEFLCTGELLNNVLQDQRRLFITADHCGIEGEGGPAASVLFYFNYTGPCGNNVSDPVPPPTFQGAQLLARDVETDFALVEITDPAPLPAGAYFAGWDARGEDPASGGVSIHHPTGDEMKIAFFDHVPTRSPINVGTGCVIPAWQIMWSEGTTQQGSSGGGLWDSTGRIIGILSGGFASCRTPNSPDYFARLDRAWTAQVAASGQLRAHLDPGGSCVATVPGLDPDDPAPGPVAPTVANMKCLGERSTCFGGGGGGGGALDALTLALLVLAARRRLQHHQQHARHRHG